jgi:ATP-binding cassette subfamily A (ABC1) protein 1
MLIIHFERKIGRIQRNQFEEVLVVLYRYFSYAPRVNAPTSTKYHSYTFIYLQNALERAIISAHTGRNISYGIQTQQMPYPCWVNDKFVNSISRLLPLFMVLSWIFTVSMNVKDIVHEKEK